MKEKQKICIMSADMIFRKGLTDILNDTKTIEATECESNCDAAVERLFRDGDKVILIDVQYPALFELEIIGCIIEKFPEAKLLAFLPKADHFATLELINRGVKGVVTHDVGLLELEAGILRLLNMDSYFSAPIIKSLKDYYWNSISVEIAEVLEKDELKLLNDIATGNSDSESCEKLSITMEHYLRVRNQLFKKTNCTTTSSLAAYSLMTKGL